MCAASPSRATLPTPSGSNRALVSLSLCAAVTTLRFFYLLKYDWDAHLFIECSRPCIRGGAINRDAVSLDATRPLNRDAARHVATNAAAHNNLVSMSEGRTHANRQEGGAMEG